MPPAAKNGMADAMPFFEAVKVKKDSFLTKGGCLTAAHAPSVSGGRRARLQAEKYFLRRTCRRRK